MPGNPTITAFAASPPPWSLASLDTNFTNVATLLKSANNYSLYLADSGAVNAYAVSFAAGVTWSLAAGAEVTVNPANTNTTASTLAVNAGTAKNIFLNGAALVGGEIRAGVPFTVVYDGTQFNMIGPYAGGNLPDGQIKFPATQNPSSNANTLDDYEEGTWTPSIGGTATYTFQSGDYTKIGREVTIYCLLGINNLGSGSTSTVTGLPFTISNPGTGDAGDAVAFFQSLAVNVISPVSYLQHGTTQEQFRGITVAGATQSSALAVFGNSARVDFSAKFHV